jgi:sterol desaturase/sphingolipid hydroxylase (fatty acid hydroxylase superfamily)
MPNLPDVVLWSVPAFVLLTVVEMVSCRLHPDEDAEGYEAKDAATSVGMGLGSLVFDFVWKIPILAIYTALYELTPLRVPVLWWTVPLMLLGQDFFYYWSHRGHHVIRILWACHVVHHSSRKFNLTTALRQPWTSLTVWPFYVPLVVAGVHPAALAFCSSANLVYQFWIHTERIDKMPRWFEFVFNTPSHHRVHHASQGGYLDRNFGGILIVWDRLFGSFVAETERPRYGLTKNITTYNLFKVATHEYVAIAKDLRAARSWRERAGRVFRGPGWGPGPAAPAPTPSPASAPTPSPAPTQSPAPAQAPSPTAVLAPSPAAAQAPAPSPADATTPVSESGPVSGSTLDPAAVPVADAGAAPAGKSAPA